MDFIWVAAGGALGAVMRYAMGLIPHAGTFPVITLVVNVMGAVLIGFIAGMAERRELPAQLVLFVKTGVCGGFTTFSTFSLEAWTLIQDGRWLMGGTYAVLSVTLCVAGVIAGQALAGLVR